MIPAARAFAAAAAAPVRIIRARALHAPVHAPAGRALLRELAAADSLRPYLALTAQLCAQPDHALHGASTLAVVLNALGVDPGRAWKRPWRWWSTSMVAGSGGGGGGGSQSSLHAFAARARESNAAAEACPARANGAAALRAVLASAAARAGAALVVAVHSRGALLPGGGGALGGSAAAAAAAADGESEPPHFSVVAGFHEARDAVLLVEVHACAAPASPRWAPLPALHAAMAATAGGGWVTVRAATAATATAAAAGAAEEAAARGGDTQG